MRITTNLLAILFFVNTLESIAQGPVLVKDINPGQAFAFQPSRIIPGVDLNGIYIFSAQDNVSGIELWRSDGTETGTYRIKDMNPGIGDGDPKYFHLLGDKVFFIAKDDIHGFEPWVTDGTESGTFMLGDFNADPSASIFSNFAPSSSLTTKIYATLGSYCYFLVRSPMEYLQLWRSDGTETGTTLVADICTGPCLESIPNSFFLWSIDVLDSTLFFNVNPRTIWQSDGTNAGTRPLFNPQDSFFFSARLVQVMNDKLMIQGRFTAQSPVSRFASDGTIDGTEFITEGASDIMFVFKDKIHFVKDSQLHAWDPTTGISSGLIPDLKVGTGTVAHNNFYIWKNKVYFSAHPDGDSLVYIYTMVRKEIGCADLS